MNFKMILEYDGSRYNGWQRQGNTHNTIQGKLEEILSKYFEQDIEVHGSGRTDAGVHAMGQVINFKIDKYKFYKSTPEYETENRLHENNLQQALNSYLPEDIRIISLNIVDDRFHARLNAKCKTYRYKLCLSPKKNVFERKYCASLPETTHLLNIDAMKLASLYLLGEHDLIGFSDTKTKKSTIRRIDSITFSQENINNCEYLIVDFTGNGFLYHTVRLMMGTLIQIGLEKCTPDIIKKILDSKDRKQVPYMAPAEGLYLMNVEY